MDRFDIGILGAGPGGYVAAIRGAQMGAKVCVIEQEEVGGTCLNWGCIPTKALVASVRALEQARRGKEYGFTVGGDITPDFDRMMARKSDVVQRQIKGIRSLFKEYGITLIQGCGKLTGEKILSVEGPDGAVTQMEADKIIIATGSRPSNLPGISIDGQRIISSNEALTLKDVPENILIVGAGVIGCEFAAIFRALGSTVTIVELLERAIPMEDPEISAILERELKKQKIKLITGTSVTSTDQAENGKILAHLSDDQAIESDMILLSVGRTFNVSGIGLENVGVEQGKRGEILVNGRMETNIDGIYAIGDVVGGMMLAHVASREGIVAVENALGAGKEMDYSAIPACIYSHPEAASVGMKESEAIEKGYSVKIGRFQMRGIGMAHALGELSGLVKVVADEKTDAILGAHMIGAHVTEMVHQAVEAIHGKVSAGKWAEMVHAHPTMSESLQEAVHDLHGMAVHLPPTRPQS